MNRKRIANLVLTFGLLTIGASSCEILDPYDPGNGGGGNGGGCDTVITHPDEMIEARGTVHYVTNIEGTSFWGIESEDGRRFEPSNLPEAFMQDGMKVEFKGYLLKDWASYNYYGEIVEIVEIRSAE
jgi:hypothetical protein